MRTLPDPKSLRKLPSFFLLTDEARGPEPLAAAAALEPGAGVILRHYNDPKRRQLAHELADVCRAGGVSLLVAGDARLAREVGADGFHLPEHMVRHGDWRLWRRPAWLVTAAAHSPTALHYAARAGADAALLSPVYPTKSHPGAAAIGPLRFALWAGQAPLPVYALGGITEGWRLARLNGSRAAGWATVSGRGGGGGVSGIVA